MSEKLLRQLVRNKLLERSEGDSTSKGAGDVINLDAATADDTPVSCKVKDFVIRGELYTIPEIGENQWGWKDSDQIESCIKDPDLTDDVTALGQNWAEARRTSDSTGNFFEDFAAVAYEGTNTNVEGAASDFADVQVGDVYYSVKGTANKQGKSGQMGHGQSASKLSPLISLVMGGKVNPLKVGVISGQPDYTKSITYSAKRLDDTQFDVQRAYMRATNPITVTVEMVSSDHPGWVEPSPTKKDPNRVSTPNIKGLIEVQGKTGTKDGTIPPGAQIVKVIFAGGAGLSGWAYAISTGKSGKDKWEAINDKAIKWLQGKAKRGSDQQKAVASLFTSPTPWESFGWTGSSGKLAWTAKDAIAKKLGWNDSMDRSLYLPLMKVEDSEQLRYYLKKIPSLTQAGPEGQLEPEYERHLSSSKGDVADGVGRLKTAQSDRRLKNRFMSKARSFSDAPSKESGDLLVQFVQAYVDDILGKPAKNESLVRSAIQNILLEELTKADKKEIDKLIKKGIEKDRAEQKKLIQKELEAELKKSLGQSFFRQPGKIRKTIEDVCRQELAREMKKGSDLEKSVVAVTKKVLSAWHELLYKQQHIIQRVKI